MELVPKKPKNKINKYLSDLSNLIESQESLVSKIKKAKHLIKKYPKRSKLYVILGNCYNKLGNLKKSILCFEFATKLDGRNAYLYEKIIDLCYKQNQFEKVFYYTKFYISYLNYLYRNLKEEKFLEKIKEVIRFRIQLNLKTNFQDVKISNMKFAYRFGNLNLLIFENLFHELYKERRYKELHYIISTFIGRQSSPLKSLLEETSIQSIKPKEDINKEKEIKDENIKLEKNSNEILLDIKSNIYNNDSNKDGEKEKYLPKNNILNKTISPEEENSLIGLKDIIFFLNTSLLICIRFENFNLAKKIIFKYKESIKRNGNLELFLSVSVCCILLGDFYNFEYFINEVSRTLLEFWEMNLKENSNQYKNDNKNQKDKKDGKEIKNSIMFWIKKDSKEINKNKKFNFERISKILISLLKGLVDLVIVSLKSESKKTCRNIYKFINENLEKVENLKETFCKADEFQEDDGKGKITIRNEYNSERDGKENDEESESSELDFEGEEGEERKQKQTFNKEIKKENIRRIFNKLKISLIYLESFIGKVSNNKILLENLSLFPSDGYKFRAFKIFVEELIEKKNLKVLEKFFSSNQTPSFLEMLDQPEEYLDSITRLDEYFKISYLNDLCFFDSNVINDYNNDFSNIEKEEKDWENEFKPNNIRIYKKIIVHRVIWLFKLFLPLLENESDSSNSKRTKKQFNKEKIKNSFLNKKLFTLFFNYIIGKEIKCLIEKNDSGMYTRKRYTLIYLDKNISNKVKFQFYALYTLFHQQKFFTLFFPFIDNLLRTQSREMELEFVYFFFHFDFVFSKFKIPFHSNEKTHFYFLVQLAIIYLKAEESKGMKYIFNRLSAKKGNSLLICYIIQKVLESSITFKIKNSTLRSWALNKPDHLDISLLFMLNKQKSFYDYQLKRLLFFEKLYPLESKVKYAIGINKLLETKNRMKKFDVKVCICGFLKVLEGSELCDFDGKGFWRYDIEKNDSKNMIRDKALMYENKGMEKENEDSLKINSSSLIDKIRKFNTKESFYNMGDIDNNNYKKYFLVGNIFEKFGFDFCSKEYYKSSLLKLLGSSYKFDDKSENSEKARNLYALFLKYLCTKI